MRQSGNIMKGINQVNSLYIHFPHCRHLCNYCDFFKSVPDDFDEAREKFQARLEAQWDVHQKWFKQNNLEFGSLETLYLGGGTPSLWEESGAKWFKSFLLKYLYLKDGCEWTMEVNPKAWSEIGLAAWENIGVNRFSSGVQSYDERFLKVLDRVHQLDDVKILLNHLQGKRFSVDLMLGLPFSEQWQRNLKEEINRLIDAGAEHFSVYILTVKENYKYYKDLPSEEYISDEYLLTHELLESNGFEHYEVSNFAKPNARSKHNLRYWNSQSVAALGPSAVGFIAPLKQRYKWHAWQDTFEIEHLDDEALKTEDIYLRLRLKEGIENIDEIIEPSKRAAYDQKFENWQSKGWTKNTGPQSLQLSALGFLMMDSVIMDIISI